MTTKMQSSTKTILLLLAGVGALGALALIALGLVLFFAQADPPETVVDQTPTATATATVALPSPTVMAGVVVLASATPLTVGVTTPQVPATDTLSKPPTATRRPTNTPTATTDAAGIFHEPTTYQRCLACRGGPFRIVANRDVCAKPPWMGSRRS